jgi:hypothetical protein
VRCVTQLLEFFFVTSEYSQAGLYLLLLVSNNATTYRLEPELLHCMAASETAPTPKARSQQGSADGANWKQASLLVKDANVLEAWVDVAGGVPQSLTSTEAFATVLTKLRKLTSAAAKLAAIPETSPVANAAEVFDVFDTACRAAASGLAFVRDVIKATSRDKWEDDAGMLATAANFGAPEACILCIKAVSKRKDVCANSLLCLSAIVLCRSDLRDFATGECAEGLRSILKLHRKDSTITTNAFKLIRLLCSNSVARQDTLLQANTLPGIIRCMEEHLGIGTIQAEGARILGNFSSIDRKCFRQHFHRNKRGRRFRSADTSRNSVVAMGGVRLCREALKAHVGDEQVVEWTAGAIANMSSDNCTMFDKLQVSSVWSAKIHACR